MEKLLEILSELRPDLDFGTQTKLIDDGILDSFDVIAVVAEVGEAFDVSINAAHLTPENFNSADAMYALIQRLAQA